MFVGDVLSVVSFVIAFIVIVTLLGVFKKSALTSTLSGFLVEIAVLTILFPSVNIVQASLWASIDMYAFFGVLWAGMVFAAMFRDTGLLKIFVDELHMLFEDAWGTVSGMVGTLMGVLGEFNGFAAIPILVPGIKHLGYESWRAVAGYLVMSAWCIPLVSLWIGAIVASAATHVAVAQFAPYVGMISIPLVVVSTAGAMYIFRVKPDRFHINIALIYSVPAIASIIVFSILLPSAYLLTLVVYGVTVLLLYIAYSNHLHGTGKEGAYSGEGIRFRTLVRPFAPILLGIVLVLLWTYPLSGYVAKANFTIGLWTYPPISINLLTTPAFYIIVTAFSTYLFIAIGKPAKKLQSRNKAKPAAAPEARIGPLRAFGLGSRLSGETLLTAFFASSIAGMAMASGQLASLKTLMISTGTIGYAVLLNVFSLAFGTSVTTAIASFMISSFQVAAASVVSLPAVLLIGVVVTLSMGVTGIINPSIIIYSSTLAEGAEGDHSRVFKTTVPWAVIMLIVTIATTLVIIAAI